MQSDNSEPKKFQLSSKRLFHNSFEKRFRDLLLPEASRDLEKKVMELWHLNKNLEAISKSVSLSKQEVWEIVNSYKDYIKGNPDKESHKLGWYQIQGIFYYLMLVLGFFFFFCCAFIEFANISFEMARIPGLIATTSLIFIVWALVGFSSRIKKED